MSEIKRAGDTEKDGSAYTVPELEGVVPAEDGSQYASNEAESQDDLNVYAPRPNEGISDRAYTGNVYERKYYFDEDSSGAGGGSGGSGGGSRPDDWPDGETWPPVYPPEDAWPPGWIPPSEGGGGGEPTVCVGDQYYSCGPTNDPYWANVVLMLHFDGANGATTFTDSSSSAKTPASSSGCTLSTTSPKFGTAALSSTTASADLTYTSSTDFNLPLVYTIEFWIYLDALPGASVYIAGSSAARYFTITSAGQLSAVGWNGTGFGACTLATGVWQHYAQTRDGDGTNRNFLNGVQLGSGTDSGTSLGAIAFQLLGIPARPDLASFQGKIDDFRWTQGIARYTGNFNIPTAAFPDALETVWDPADPRTVLSLHAEDTDDSSCYQPKTVTLAGSAAVSTTEKKFDTASFSVANAGTSTANGVVIMDHQDFDFGTGDFTIEMWAYRTANTYYGTLFYGTYGGEFSLIVSPTTGLVVLNYRSSGGAQANIATGVVFPLTTWQHVVVQRRGTNFEFYLNGVLGNTTAITGGASSTVNSTGDFYLGRTNASSALTWAGYIDEVRITKGVARIANPNLPTEAFPDSAPDDPYWANVVLMLPMAVDFSDSSETTKTVTPAGDAQITATSPKFGIGSGLFDGTGDLLSVTHTSELTLGTSDFTFEAWIRLSEINRWHGIIGNGTGAGAIDFVVATTPNNFLRVYADSGTLNLNAVTALVVDTWYHVALVRSGNVFTIFLNGVIESTATVTVTLSATSAWKIAGDYTSTPLKGQMAYARVTKGVARYPTSFTPPAQPNCDSVVPGNIVAIPGTSPLTGMSVAVQQQSIGDQNGAVALSNTVIDIGPPLEYRVNRADVFAGNLTVSSVATDKTVALTGRSVTVSRGTLAVPAYPNLISVSTTTIEAVATGNTAKLTFTFFTDGTYTVVDQALTTRTSGTWIDTAQTNYSIPAISNQYRVVTINIFAGTSYTYSTLPFTLGTSFSVVIQNLASSTLNIFDFQLTISPTSTNPRYAEPYYYGTHRFKAVLSNDMS